MAQAFITTYRNNFRWHTQTKTKPIIDGGSILPDCDEDEDLWLMLVDNVQSETDGMLSQAEAAVKQMQLKRWRSTYQVDYCRDLWKKMYGRPTDSEQASYGNELLESCRILFDKKRGKIIPPLPTSRQVNGYIRPARLHVPLTRYQNDIGKVGYELLKKCH
ncbi:hypothetical protein JTB14_001727 [Gonioctena quinquepunctata]|nr:hypothetical protein JTB14_001727 [Gonioctena quinquepunctata]